MLREIYCLNVNKNILTNKWQRQPYPGSQDRHQSGLSSVCVWGQWCPHRGRDHREYRWGWSRTAGVQEAESSFPKPCSYQGGNFQLDLKRHFNLFIGILEKYFQKFSSLIIICRKGTPWSTSQGNVLCYCWFATLWGASLVGNLKPATYGGQGEMKKEASHPRLVGGRCSQHHITSQGCVLGAASGSWEGKGNPRSKDRAEVRSSKCLGPAHRSPGSHVFAMTFPSNCRHQDIRGSATIVQTPVNLMLLKLI